MSDDQISLERGRGWSKEEASLNNKCLPQISSGGGVRERGGLNRVFTLKKPDKINVKHQKLTE